MPRRSSRFAGLLIDGRIVSADSIVRTSQVGTEQHLVEDVGWGDAAVRRLPVGTESSTLEVTCTYDDDSELDAMLRAWDSDRASARTWCWAPATNVPGSRVWMGRGLHVTADPVETPAGDVARQGVTFVLSGPTSRGRLICWDRPIAGPNGDAGRNARRLDLLGPRIPLGGAPPSAGGPPRNEREYRTSPGTREVKSGGTAVTAYDVYCAAEHRLLPGDDLLLDSDLTVGVDVVSVPDRNRVRVSPTTTSIPATSYGPGPGLDDVTFGPASAPTYLAAFSTGPDGPAGAAGWALGTAHVDAADGATSLLVSAQHSANGSLWQVLGQPAAHTPPNWPRPFVALASGRIDRYLGWSWNAAGAGAGFRGRVTLAAAITGGNR